MRVIVTTLMLFFVVLITSGCSSKIIFVPKSCVIPSVEEVELDLADKNTTLGEAKRCATNYTRYKEAYEKQKKMIEVCR